MLGGTGPAGPGWPAAWRRAGTTWCSGPATPIGPRRRSAELRERWGDRVATLRAGDNAEAAAQDVVVIATVWDAAVPTAAELADLLDGKIVDQHGERAGEAGPRPSTPSSRRRARSRRRSRQWRRALGWSPRFQHVPAAALRDLDTDLESDVLVAGDDDEARWSWRDLIDAMPGLRVLDAGALANAVGIETFAAALLTVNLRHKGEATLRLVGRAPPVRPRR